jgi:hypothetical protein
MSWTRMYAQTRGSKGWKPPLTRVLKAAEEPSVVEFGGKGVLRNDPFFLKHHVPLLPRWDKPGEGRIRDDRCPTSQRACCWSNPLRAAALQLYYKVDDADAYAKTKALFLRATHQEPEAKALSPELSAIYAVALDDFIWVKYDELHRGKVTAIMEAETPDVVWMVKFDNEDGVTCLKNIEDDVPWFLPADPEVIAHLEAAAADKNKENVEMAASEEAAAIPAPRRGRRRRNNRSSRAMQPR